MMPDRKYTGALITRSILFYLLTGHLQAQQTPVLVKDINPGGNAITAGLNGTVIGDKMLFSAYEPETGHELWITDGTSEGTKLLKDIVPGAESSSLSRFFSYRGIAYIGIGLGIGTLWRSDGTPDGTFSFDIGESCHLCIEVEFGDQLYIYQPLAGLSHLDPDKQKLTPVIDRSLDPELYAITNQIARMGENWLFSGVLGPVTSSLYISDGTSEGTRTILTPSDVGDNAVATRSEKLAFFNNKDDSHGRELWVTDGTAGGTRMVKDIRAGSGSAMEKNDPIVPLDNSVLFVANDNVTGKQLWVSDGTEAGTIRLKVFTADGTNPAFKFFKDTLDGAVFFHAAGGLWRSDGTESGTYRISASSRSHYGLKKAGSWLYYMNSSSQLLRTNGKPGNSEVIATLNNVGYNYVDGYNTDFVVAGGNIYYQGGNELWKVSICNYNSVITSSSGEATVINSCSPEPRTLEVSTNGGSGSFTYEWRHGNALIGRSKNITISEAGTYTVEVVNQGCAITNTIEVRETGGILASVTGTNVTCEGAASELSTSVSGGKGPYTYQWKHAGADIAGAVAAKYLPSETGVYSVLVTDSQGCTGISSVFPVEVKPVPKPTITSGAVYIVPDEPVQLRTEAASGQTYQWFRNNQPLPGATGATYITTEAGEYTVAVTHGECTATSSAFQLQMVLAREPAFESLKLEIFPNPFQNEAEIKLNAPDGGSAILTLLDSGGKPLMESSLTGISAGYTFFLPLQQLQAGVYFIRVNAGGQQKVRRVVKQ